MRLLVSADHMELSTSLRDQIDRCLYFALGRFGPAIDYVDVRVGDINGPCGGVDKHCRIVVKLRGSGAANIALDDHDDNVYAAVSQAVARVGRTVARAVERRQGKRAYQRRRMSMANVEMERLDDFDSTE